MVNFTDKQKGKLAPQCASADGVIPFYYSLKKNHQHITLLQIFKIIFFILLLIGLNSYSFADAVADAETTRIVTNAIASDPTLANANIMVSTNNGVVSLAGNVNSDDAFVNAVAFAQAAPNVTDVNTNQLNLFNNLKASPDLLITGKLKGLFIRNKILGDTSLPFTITIETTNGVVLLGGTAITPNQVQNAVEMAKTVPGVSRVESVIKVGGEVVTVPVIVNAPAPVVVTPTPVVVTPTPAPVVVTPAPAPVVVTPATVETPSVSTTITTVPTAPPPPAPSQTTTTTTTTVSP